MLKKVGTYDQDLHSCENKMDDEQFMLNICLDLL